jgi:hypothetical protein
MNRYSKPSCCPKNDTCFRFMACDRTDKERKKDFPDCWLPNVLKGRKMMIRG